MNTPKPVAIAATASIQPHNTGEVGFATLSDHDQREAYLDIDKRELNGRAQRLVSLRSLHKKLGVDCDFAHWAKHALTNSKSIDGVDFLHVVRTNFMRIAQGPHQGEIQKTSLYNYYVSFEKAKIIAAESGNTNSADGCEWLVRVEKQG